MRMDFPSAETLLRGCPTPLALVSAEGETLATNAPWEARVGGGPIDARLHENDRPAFAAARRAALEGDTTQSLDVRLARPGELARLTFWRADERTLWASAEVSRDENEERTVRILLDCFRMMDATVWSCDTTGKILISDGKALSHLGLVPGQVVGLNVFDLFPPDAGAITHAKRALAGESFFYEDVSDTVHWLNVYTPRRDANGEVLGLQCFSMNLMHDVVMMKKSKALTDCVERLPITVWAFDKEGTCTLFAGALRNRRGSASEDLVGKNIFELYSQRTDIITDMRRAIAGEEHVAERTFGDVHIRTRYVPIRDPYGGILSVCAVAEDATEQLRIEAQLRAHVELVEAQQQAIAELGTPIIEVWNDVLAVPVVGALDEKRAEQMLGALLDEVVSRQARFALLDLTGVESVDAATAQHLIRVVDAVRLLGCEGLITGIRPSVAETLVGLDVDLSKTRTVRSLKDALRLCSGLEARGKR